MEKKLINLYPASRWIDTTPLGNGVIGASVYGCRYDERILFNHEALYNYANKKEMPDVSDSLPIVRALMDEGKYEEANSYYTKVLEEKGYISRKGKYYPAFDLHMLFGGKEDFTDYSRVLDMEHGLCTVEYKEDGALCRREIFASATDRVVVVRLTKDTPFRVKLTLERHDLADCVDDPRHVFSSMAKGNAVYSLIETEGKLRYSGMVKVHATDGKVSTGDDEKRDTHMRGEAVLSDYVEVTDATELTLIFDLWDKAGDFDAMKASLDGVTLSYKELLDRHTAVFAERFNRTRLTLSKGDTNPSVEELLLNGYSGTIDNRLTEKMADFGRYLLISASVDCRFPANLQGLWNGEYSPAWSCTYFNNENIQMAYWQACRGGMSEALIPFFDLYDSFKEDYRTNAKKLFGCRGLLLPLFMDNSNGQKDNLQPHVLYWTGSSAWVSAIYYEYYLFTMDKKFLAERAYPFMKECALFYEDFMVYDANGHLKSYPSNSPENAPNGDFAGAGKLSVSINATMDFAMLKELLTNLLSAADALGLDEEKRPVWAQMLAAIPPYEINEDGALKEWLHPDFKDNYHHRHQSHIYPLFPGFEIDEDKDPALFAATKVAVEKRLCIGMKEQTGWSLSHMANIFARLSDGASAKRCLDLLLRFCTGQNLYTYHNDWRNMGVTLKMLHAGKPPFQIDANLGFVAAVYEMLVFTTPEKIKLLPALPAEWTEGALTGLNTHVGCRLDLAWCADGVTATLTAERDTAFDLATAGRELISATVAHNASPVGPSYRYFCLKQGESVTVKYK